MGQPQRCARAADRVRFRFRVWSDLALKDSDYPYVSAIGLVALAFLIRLGLTPLLNDRSPWLLFTVAIVIAAGRYGVRPALLVMALSLMLGLAAFVGGANIGNIPAESIASLVVFLVTGAAMLVFATHLKASQQRAVQLQAELSQAHTESALGTMASILAHELNQPLAAATNYVAACKRMIGKLEGAPKAKILTGIGEAEGQIERVGEIIRHARDLVRDSGAKRESASLRTMISRVTEVLTMGGSGGKAIIRNEVNPEADELVANPIQIEQVLMNLLRNACQMSDRGDEVVVSAKPVDGFARIEVRDQGAGIPEDRLPALFSTRGQSTHGGLGLGLSISRTIVEAHGGRIWAENRPGGGASFFFTVPRGG